MLHLVAFLGILIIAGCIVGIVSPVTLFGVVTRFARPSGLAFAVAIRVIFGVAAILAAPASLAPTFLYVIGVIALIAAAALPFIGVARTLKIVEWFGRMNPQLIRLYLVAGSLFGLALIWSTGLWQQ